MGRQPLHENFLRLHLSDVMEIAVTQGLNLYVYIPAGHSCCVYSAERCRRAVVYALAGTEAP